jgi:hypothetical protein
MLLMLYRVDIRSLGREEASYSTVSESSLKIKLKKFSFEDNGWEGDEGDTVWHCRFRSYSCLSLCRRSQPVLQN